MAAKFTNHIWSTWERGLCPVLGGGDHHRTLPGLTHATFGAIVVPIIVMF